MERVEVNLQDTTTVLDEVGDNQYQTSLTAPATKTTDDVQVYPVAVTATGDNGEVAEETTELLVTSGDSFRLLAIAADPEGKEIGFCKEKLDLDIDLGDTNDFELRMADTEWSKDKYWYEHRLFIPLTEFGGIIDDIEVLTSTSEIVFRGLTWRGMLQKKIVRPPDDASHLILNGELNSVLRELIGDRFGSLFVVPETDTGIEVAGWQVDRYVTLYDAIMKLLMAYGQRLQIAYYEPEGLEYGYVLIQAVPVVDYSGVLEYSQDGKVQFTVRDYRGGINHLVCVGTGQNEERIVLDLYVQEGGSIGDTQYYTGLKERAAVYEYTSADEAELRESGTERLKELQNFKSIEVTVDDIDLEVGDIIGGYEQITETYVAKPIVGKIFKYADGDATIEYKVKGDD